MCRWFYWYLKWPPQVDFLNICDRKNPNLVYGGGWYRTSSLLFQCEISCVCSTWLYLLSGIRRRRLVVIYLLWRRELRRIHRLTMTRHLWCCQTYHRVTPGLSHRQTEHQGHLARNDKWLSFQTRRVRVSASSLSALTAKVKIASARQKGES